MKKFALICFGSEESYGLLFAGEEFKKHGEIKYFDAEDERVIINIVEYRPDFICFSPMTTYVERAKGIERAVKCYLDEVVSIYGGHHATNAGVSLGDITVVGSVHGIDLEKRGIVYGGPTKPEYLKMPARSEYYRDIPRMRDRYRKIMLSVTGCPFTCSYCSSSAENTRRVYGCVSDHLKHRDIDDIIKEVNEIKEHTVEIEWVDDDILYGDQQWLHDFLNRWINEAGLLMYVSTTSMSALKASDEILRLMRNTVNCVGLGVQASNRSSMELLGRKWDSKEKIKQAYDRLVSFGFRVNMQMIAGLPIDNPVEDALDTVDFLRKVGLGSIISCYPLQIYPGTKMERYCKENGFLINPECVGDTNTGLPAINFGEKVNNRIRNICKLATPAVKYGISRQWLQALLDVDLEEASKPMSLMRYYECVKDRLPDKADSIFSNIVETMKFKY